MKKEGLPFVGGVLCAIVISPFAPRLVALAPTQGRELAERSTNSPAARQAPAQVEWSRGRGPASVGPTPGDNAASAGPRSVSKSRIALAPFQQLKDTVFADHRLRWRRIEEKGFQRLKRYGETDGINALMETLAGRQLPPVDLDQYLFLNLKFQWNGQVVEILVWNSGNSNVWNLSESHQLVLIKSQSGVMIIYAENWRNTLIRGPNVFLYLDLASCNDSGLIDMQGLILPYPENPTDRSALILRAPGEGSIEIPYAAKWQVGTLDLNLEGLNLSRCRPVPVDFLKYHFQDP